MGFYVGAYVPMYKGQEADVTLGLTYGYFNSDGLGYRAGFQYTYRVAEIDNSFGFPIALPTGTKPFLQREGLRGVLLLPVKHSAMRLSWGTVIRSGEL